VSAHALAKRGPRCCRVRPPLNGLCLTPGEKWRLDVGVSAEFGARELKRTVQRNFIQPVAALVAQGQVPPGATVILDAKGGDFTIFLRQ
jgi:hypothetical protein